MDGQDFRDADLDGLSISRRYFLDFQFMLEIQAHYSSSAGQKMGHGSKFAETGPFQFTLMVIVNGSTEMWRGGAEYDRFYCCILNNNYYLGR
jgi:hypothetical protein